jgi:hypothetical protein
MPNPNILVLVYLRVKLGTGFKNLTGQPTHRFGGWGLQGEPRKGTFPGGGGGYGGTISIYPCFTLLNTTSRGCGGGGSWAKTETDLMRTTAKPFRNSRFGLVWNRNRLGTCVHCTAVS